MARIGLDKPEPQYLDVLIKIMEMKFFFAVLGGTPRYAHLFFKHREGYLGMLDPHETRRTVEEIDEMPNHLGEYTGKLEWIKKEKISSSMCLMFVLNKKEVDEFWVEMKALREKSGDSFFLYLA